MHLLMMYKVNLQSWLMIKGLWISLTFTGRPCPVNVETKPLQFKLVSAQDPEILCLFLHLF